MSEEGNGKGQEPSKNAPQKQLEFTKAEKSALGWIVFGVIVVLLTIFGTVADDKGSSSYSPNSYSSDHNSKKYSTMHPNGFRVYYDTQEELDEFNRMLDLAERGFYD